jgi:asparagine synthetase B (glutamine-hydrolysing)
MSFDNNIITDGIFFFKKIKLKLKKINNYKFQGSFAFYKKYKKNYLIARDHLGNKKIFWGFKKKIYFSHNFLKLSKKIDLRQIRSAEAGKITMINKIGKIIKTYEIKRINDVKFTNLRKHSDLIKKEILFFLNGIKKIYGNKIYVCLSGGLDSALIAYFASKIFSKVTAVSCCMIKDADYNKYIKNKKISFPLSDDFVTAKKIAKIIKIKFQPIFFPESNCSKDLKKVMYSCQDWRDFNVHCAILNFQIAKFLNNNLSYKKEPLLTGDFMNEYVADYTSEKNNGLVQYKQPNQSRAIRQKYYIKGLSSSDRENGIFKYFNIPSFQPYCYVDALYKNLPKNFLNKNNAKYILNGSFLNKRILKIINKKKYRAQVGGSNGGILNYMISKKIFQKDLNRKFNNFFKTDNKFLSNFIYLGSYKN